MEDFSVGPPVSMATNKMVATLLNFGLSEKLQHSKSNRYFSKLFSQSSLVYFPLKLHQKMFLII